MTLRLRQICLAVPDLEPAVALIRGAFGVEVCHRDDGVAKYGLVNALFVFGHQFVELVAPTRDDTTAGRFIARSGGRGGYMAIFDSHDPERRSELAESLGVRIAHTMDYPGKFFGVQLHPRDCRATMLEFDRSVGNERLDGSYWPAGEHWHAQQDLGRVRGIRWVDVTAPDPQDLAAHWGRIADRPVTDDGNGHPSLRFDLGAARFLAGESERLDTLHVDVDDAAAVTARARSMGCVADAGGFLLGGVRFVLHEGAAVTVTS
jgi:hypothetical protein